MYSFILCIFLFFFFSSRRRHTRCALVTGFRRVLFRSHIGHTDRTIHRIALRHFELRLHGASLTERGRQVRQPLHHLSKMPVCKAAMLAPCNPIQIEEEAWLWLTNEFVDLAADVAQIDVRAIGVAHVNRMAAAEIHADMWVAGANDMGLGGWLDMRR